MVRWLGVVLIGACLGMGPAQAQFQFPGTAQPQPEAVPPADTPELKPPPSPIITARNRASLSACKKIGGVQAVAPVAGQTGLAAYDVVLVEMKEKVLEAGGTHLLLIDTSSGTVEAKGNGEAYNCPPGKGPAAVKPKH